MLAAVRDGSAGAGTSGFAFARPPGVERITFAGETRTAVVTPASGWRWRGRVPALASLHLGLQRAARDSDLPPDLELHVTLRAGDHRELVTRELDIGVVLQRWNDFAFDLAAHGGDEIEIEAAVIGRDGHAPELSIAWSPAIVSAGRPRPADERPSVILVLIDTLRADHLSSYGYARATSPEIDRRLAREGVLFERAYAQAPWTLPSVASLHSGLPPAEIWASQGSRYRLPATGPLLAERFSALGYDTAAFVANPVVHAGLGYDRGFDTYYTPTSVEAINSTASSAPALQQRIEPWLRAHRERPFFLYAHYFDPHSPYENPDLENGRSPFFPDYRGHITGRHVHGLFLGRVQLADPVADVAHLTALYDSEIAYVDRYVGRLLDLAAQHGDRDLLIALTSDHGEELYDHRGWDHALTLYDELLRVPLVLRWPGRLPRGARVAAPVALLDLAPTLVAAAGGELPRAWSGSDLRSALAPATPARPVFAERVERYDPRRVAVVSGDRKLVLFDRRGAEGLELRNDRQRIVQQQALQRLAARELYDLARDPREQINLAGSGGGELEVMLHRHLDAFLPGLRVVARGLALGEVLEAEVELDGVPARWSSLFLQGEDRVEIAQQRVRVRFVGDGWIKGVLLEGDALGVRSVRTLDSTTVAARVAIGDESGLRAQRWPLDGPGPILGVWLGASLGDRAAPQEIDAETARRLRELGYAD
jgi:arylsulfatase A-like enzyme